MAAPKRQRRLKDDLRVSKARDIVRDTLKVDLEFTDPKTGRPVHGNTKLSTLRERAGSAGTPGQPRFRAVRGDATVGSAERVANRVFGFDGPVLQAFNDDGRNTRSDKRVKKHRGS